MDLVALERRGVGPTVDLNGDQRSGDLRLYRGTSAGGVRGGIVIGTGWQRYL